VPFGAVDDDDAHVGRSTYAEHDEVFVVIGVDVDAGAAVYAPVVAGEDAEGRSYRLFFGIGSR
jgi:hypothetical protein